MWLITAGGVTFAAFPAVYATMFSSLYTPLMLILKKLWRLPAWLQVHGIDAWEKRSNFIRNGVESADLVTSVSRFTRHRLMQWAGIAPNKIRVLPNTIDRSFKPGEKSQALMRSLCVEGKRVLLTVGRLSASEKYKGYDAVMELLPELLKEYPELFYMIVGEGDDRNRLEEKVKTMNLTRYVRFMRYVEEEDLREIYRIADLYVMPSIGEGFGIAFLEAGASGVPVIGCDQDGTVDALREGYLGKTVKREGLSQAIKESLSKEILRGDALSRRVQGTFGKNLFQRHLEKLLMFRQK